MNGSDHTAASASSSSTSHHHSNTTSPPTYHYRYDDDNDDDDISINNETTRVQVEKEYLPVDPTEVHHEEEEELGGDWAANNGTCCCCNFTSVDANVTTNATNATATILTSNSTRGPGDSYYFYEVGTACVCVFTVLM